MCLLLLDHSKHHSFVLIGLVSGRSRRGGVVRLVFFVDHIAGPLDRACSCPCRDLC